MSPKGFAQRAASLSQPKAMPDGQEYRSLDAVSISTLADEFLLPLYEAEALALDEGCIPEHYVRNFRTLDYQGQAALLRSRLAMVGLGGLGGYVLEILARMGVGSIEAADGDTFEESNLNRQLLSQAGGLEISKAQAAHQRCGKLNPSVHITAHSAFLDENGMHALLGGADVAVDALGGLDDRPALARMASELGIPLVTAAVSGMTGYVATVLPGGPALADVLGTGKAAEDTQGCPAPAVSLAASLQTAEVIRLLTGEAAALAGKMLVFDLSDMTFETVVLSD